MADRQNGDIEDAASDAGAGRDAVRYRAVTEREIAAVDDPRTECGFAIGEGEVDKIRHRALVDNDAALRAVATDDDVTEAICVDVAVDRDSLVVGQIRQCERWHGQRRGSDRMLLRPGRW